MNTNRTFRFVFALVAIITIAFGLHAFAQSNDLSVLPGDLPTHDTNSPPDTNAPGMPPAPTTDGLPSASALLTSILMIVVPVLTPVLVRLGTTYVTAIPTWFLPILAPILVAVVNWLSLIAGGPSINPILALALGSAGVGLREVKDQVQKRIANGPSIAEKIPLILIGFLAVGLTACGILKGPTKIAPGADPVIVTSEWTAENAANAFDNFFAFERAHEQPGSAVNRLAESLRSEPGKPGIAAQGIIDLRQSTERYRLNKSAANSSDVVAKTGFLLDLANTVRKAAGLPPLVPPVSSPTVRQLMTTAPTNAPPVVTQ